MSDENGDRNLSFEKKTASNRLTGSLTTRSEDARTMIEEGRAERVIWRAETEEEEEEEENERGREDDRIVIVIIDAAGARATRAPLAAAVAVADRGRIEYAWQARDVDRESMLAVVLCVSSGAKEANKKVKISSLASVLSSVLFPFRVNGRRRKLALSFFPVQCLEAAARSRGPWPVVPQRRPKSLAGAKAATKTKTTCPARPTPFTKPKTSSLPRTPAALRPGDST